MKGFLFNVRYFNPNPIKSSSVCKCNGMNDQNGFVMVTALMIMVVTSLLGIAALNTATFEIKIAGNEKQYQRQFYYSDAAINAMLGEENKPNSGHLPDAFGVPMTAGVPTDPITCNNLQGMGFFVEYDTDGNAATDTTKLYYLERVSATPLEVKVLSCASLENSVAGVSAGVRFGQGPLNPGNPTDY